MTFGVTSMRSRTPIPVIDGPPSMSSHVVLKTLLKNSSSTQTEAISSMLLTIPFAPIRESIFPKLTISESSVLRVTASAMSPELNSIISPAFKKLVRRQMQLHLNLKRWFRTLSGRSNKIYQFALLTVWWYTRCIISKEEESEAGRSELNRIKN